MILLIGVETGAAFLTYGFLDMLPLWAFCWFFFGFGAIALLGAKLLLPLFKPFQEKKPAAGSAAQSADAEFKLSDDDEDSMDELKKMDGM